MNDRAELLDLIWKIFGISEHAEPENSQTKCKLIHKLIEMWLNEPQE